MGRFGGTGIATSVGFSAPAALAVEGLVCFAALPFENFYSRPLPLPGCSCEMGRGGTVQFLTHDSRTPSGVEAH